MFLSQKALMNLIHLILFVQNLEQTGDSKKRKARMKNILLSNCHTSEKRSPSLLKLNDKINVIKENNPFQNNN